MDFIFLEKDKGSYKKTFTDLKHAVNDMCLIMLLNCDVCANFKHYVQVLSPPS